MPRENVFQFKVIDAIFQRNELSAEQVAAICAICYWLMRESSLGTDQNICDANPIAL